ncbi:GrpB family protein [Gracilibacillus alcaliphilus]|uniref:GrpB family protein n=1 Tax=Gracilibacillus alcaliphilus TaxID=1401441 RepID=UPI00195C08B4|nr:GrpB family protein [Gracilibacillus alcaliphilus]MBM7675737.1 GrpB-like predicted nucleotidyltransferase (UPF0157 family) [Gracilibacillus alcaliphilus]
MDIDELIQVVPYNEQWDTLFQNEKINLLEIFEETAVDIQHFGSTAISGMCAKPIIDILAGVKSLELHNSIISQLRKLGYEEFGEAGVEGRLYFRKRHVHAYNLAVVVWNGEHWVNNLLIRDYLKKNPDIAKQYSEKKLKTIQNGHTTLLSYSDEKADYVEDLLKQAKQHIKYT